MPRYLFHLSEPGGTERDTDGVVCPDVKYARLRAIRMARDIMAGTIMDGELHLGSVIEIEDEYGKTKDRVLFVEVIRLTC